MIEFSNNGSNKNRPSDDPDKVARRFKGKEHAREYVREVIKALHAQLDPACTFIVALAVRYIEESEHETKLVCSTGGMVGRGGKRNPYTNDYLHVLLAMLEGCNDTGEVPSEVLPELENATHALMDHLGIVYGD